MRVVRSRRSRCSFATAPVGGIGYVFPEARPFPPEDREFLLALARECAQAMERARLFQKSKDAISLRDDFLSVAGHELRSPAHAVALIAESMLRRAKANEPSGSLVVGLQKLLEAVERLTMPEGSDAAVAAMHEQIDTYLHQCFMVGIYEPYVEVCRRLAELSPCSGPARWWWIPSRRCTMRR